MRHCATLRRGGEVPSMVGSVAFIGRLPDQREVVVDGRVQLVDLCGGTAKSTWRSIALAGEAGAAWCDQGCWPVGGNDCERRTSGSGSDRPPRSARQGVRVECIDAGPFRTGRAERVLDDAEPAEVEYELLVLRDQVRFDFALRHAHRQVVAHLERAGRRQLNACDRACVGRRGLQQQLVLTRALVARCAGARGYNTEKKVRLAYFLKTFFKKGPYF